MFDMTVKATDEQGLLNGRGQWRHPDGRLFEGEWKDGIPHGEMKVLHPDGTRLTADYFLGVLQQIYHSLLLELLLEQYPLLLHLLDIAN